MSGVSELDIRTLWKELDEYEGELGKEEKVLEEVWLKIAELKSKAEKDIEELNSKPEYDFLPPSTSIGLCVGGQLFETNVGILTRDPNSILASICRKSPLFEGTGDPITFYFERDWWIFRHIMNYLRSSVLPYELETLKELYSEASYYRLETLQKSIEDVPLDRVVSNVAPDIYFTWPTVNVDRLRTFK